MKKNLGVKPVMFPMPVLIVATYNEDGTANAMNAAWGGIHDTNQIGICIAPEHKTFENLVRTKAFTVSMADASHAAACDYVGIVSGNKVPDKFAKAGFHATKSEFVDAPLIDELPIAMECTSDGWSLNNELEPPPEACDIRCQKLMAACGS